MNENESIQNKSILDNIISKVNVTDMEKLNILVNLNQKLNDILEKEEKKLFDKYDSAFEIKIQDVLHIITCAFLLTTPEFFPMVSVYAIDGIDWEDAFLYIVEGFITNKDIENFLGELYKLKTLDNDEYRDMMPTSHVILDIIKKPLDKWSMEKLNYTNPELTPLALKIFSTYYFENLLSFPIEWKQEAHNGDIFHIPQSIFTDEEKYAFIAKSVKAMTVQSGGDPIPDGEPPSAGQAMDVVSQQQAKGSDPIRLVNPLRLVNLWMWIHNNKLKGLTQFRLVNPLRLINLWMWIHNNKLKGRHNRIENILKVNNIYMNYL